MENVNQIKDVAHSMLTWHIDILKIWKENGYIFRLLDLEENYTEYVNAIILYFDECGEIVLSEYFEKQYRRIMKDVGCYVMKPGYCEKNKNLKMVDDNEAIDINFSQHFFTEIANEILKANPDLTNCYNEKMGLAFFDALKSISSEEWSTSSKDKEIFKDYDYKRYIKDNVPFYLIKLHQYYKEENHDNKQPRTMEARRRTLDGEGGRKKGLQKKIQNFNK